jgi:hypothetical protein
LQINIVYFHNAKQDNTRVTLNKNPHAQALGRLGGKARAQSLSEAEIAKIASAGGKARAAKLSAAERKRIAKAAAAAREKKRREKEKLNATKTTRANRPYRQTLVRSLLGTPHH